MGLVFVYGTLMRGNAASGLMDRCKFLCRARVQGVTLLDWGYCPAAVRCDHEDAHVWGDLFSLPSDAIEADYVMERLRTYEGSTYAPEPVHMMAHGSALKQVVATMFIARRPAVVWEPNIAAWSPYSRKYKGINRRSYERREQMGV